MLPSLSMMNDSGNFSVPHCLGTLRELSSSTSKLVPCLKNFLMGSHSSSTLTASRRNGLPFMRAASFSIDGISTTQVEHQVAQKLSSTTWPRNCDSENGRPNESLSVKSGAATGKVPSVGLMGAGLSDS